LSPHATKLDKENRMDSAAAVLACVVINSTDVFGATLSS
jgi:hypothetical protein